MPRTCLGNLDYPQVGKALYSWQTVFMYKSPAGLHSLFGEEDEVGSTIPQIRKLRPEGVG